MEHHVVAALIEGPHTPRRPRGPVAPARPGARPPGIGTTFVRDSGGPTGAPVVLLLHGWAVTADLNWFPAYPSLVAHHRGSRRPPRPRPRHPSRRRDRAAERLRRRCRRRARCPRHRAGDGRRLLDGRRGGPAPLATPPGPGGWPGPGVHRTALPGRSHHRSLVPVVHAARPPRPPRERTGRGDRAAASGPAGAPRRPSCVDAVRARAGEPRRAAQLDAVGGPLPLHPLDRRGRRPDVGHRDHARSDRAHATNAAWRPPSTTSSASRWRAPTTPSSPGPTPTCPCSSRPSRTPRARSGRLVGCRHGRRSRRPRALGVDAAPSPPGRCRWS